MSDVATWADDAVSRLDAELQHYHESIPIDYLLEDAFNPERVIEQSLLAFRELVRASSSWGGLVMPRLSFGLEDSTTFQLVDSVRGNVREQFDLFMLPRLFLSLRTLSAFLFAPDWEEYRAPIDFAPPELAGLPIVATYVCYRDESARANGEFLRAVWLDQHPAP